MSPRRRHYPGPDAGRWFPTDGDPTERLAATEAALADLADNPVVPARPRPAEPTSPLVERLRQAQEEHMRNALRPNPERNTHMPNTATATAPAPDKNWRLFAKDAEGRKYIQAMRVGDATIEATHYDVDAKEARYQVAGPDGRTIQGSEVEWLAGKWYGAGERAKSLAAAVEKVLTAGHQEARAEAQPEPEEPAGFPTEGGQTVTARAVPRRMRKPAQRTLEKWVADGVAKATDGCRVEPDGTCPHGARSWLVELGMI